MRAAPDISKSQRDELEVKGLTPREIDDAVAAVRVRMPDGYTTRDVFDEATAARERPGGV